MTSIVERARGFPVGTIGVIGVPLDENSSFLRGAAFGPRSIRDTLRSGSTNMSTELGLDLGSAGGWTDLGDLALRNGAEAIADIEMTATALVSMGFRIVALGGDHSITYPIVKAYAKAKPGLTVLHLDAHPDTYDNFGDNRYSHASPFARIMEEGLGVKLIQAGIRTLNPHQREQAKRFGISTIEMKDWGPDQLPALKGPLYLSLDMDVLDPAFAPGVSHHEPGGMTARDVLSIIHSLPAETVGADIVELNPTRDPVGATSMVAAKFTKEIVGRMLQSGNQPHRNPNKSKGLMTERGPVA